MSLLTLVLIALSYGYSFFFNKLHIKYENIILEIESLIIQGTATEDDDCESACPSHQCSKETNSKNTKFHQDISLQYIPP